MKRVLIIQAQVKEYRVPFFNRLCSRLLQNGIELRVAYSDPPPSEHGKADNADLPCDYGIRVGRTWFFNERLLWQSILKEAKQADLLIFEYANKYLANHIVKAMAPWRGQKTAFWGLGENKQGNRLAFSEWYKRLRINSVDWWFAYTKGTADQLRELGVPAAKITDVQNSVDTRELARAARSISNSERADLRRGLEIGAHDPVGVYCGMLHRVKGLLMLIEACDLVRRRFNNFHLLVIGGGPERDEIEELCHARPWAHCLGPKFGVEKAQMLAIADIFLLPGRVGLAILDAFAAGLPAIATRLPIHGPEFEYLEDGVNGVISANNAEDYATRIVSLLEDEALLGKLRQGAARSAERYSIEHMVENFSEGIGSCLLGEKKLAVQTA